MKQHMIDLLPDAIRTRSESGMVIGRYISIGAIVVVMLVALSTHAHFRLERAEADYRAAEEKSRLVLTVEAEAKRLRESLTNLAQSIEQYDRIAPSLQMADLQALVSAQLPASITLERLDMEVTLNGPSHDPRIKDPAMAPKREIRAELHGFARTDADVAELVTRLDALKPLSSVSLDFSKSRIVRTEHAREFRLSFRVNLERKYDVTRVSTMRKGGPQMAIGEEVDVVE